MEPLEVISKVKEALSGYLAENDIELIEVVYRREAPGMVLRLIVDTPEGVRMDECEALNKYAGDLLDRENTIEERYTLEVSSPGLDRPLRSDRDYERVLDRAVEVTTLEKVDGRVAHEGRLVGISRSEIVVSRGGVSVVIPRDKIVRARLKIEL